MSLFGRYCYIDTPWIAGKKTRYRIISSDIKSNSYIDVPITSHKYIQQDFTENCVIVVLDTLINEKSKLLKVRVKDITLI